VTRRREPLPPIRGPARDSGQTAARLSSGAAGRSLLPTDPSALPGLPAAFQRTLLDGAASLDVPLSGAQLTDLDSYVRLLLAWTEAINLTGIREPVAVAREHLLDSLSATNLLRGLGVRNVLDLGSGGGVPGIPLAIALPDVRVLLVESIAKKSAFLRAATGALGLTERVHVAAERAEVLAEPGRERARWDAVTVRAVAALPELVELGLPLLRVTGHLVAWKRGAIEDELEAGARAARSLGAEGLRTMDVPIPALSDHCLVIVRKARETPLGFPRRPAERKTHPW
jgi:16S rRNA (guanine527-N7)-methyltransferase